MEPLFRCPICFESLPMAEMCFTKCEHTFCERCLSTYFQDKPGPCPACRQRVATLHFFPRFYELDSSAREEPRDAHDALAEDDHYVLTEAGGSGVPEGSSTEGEDPDLTFRDGDQAGLERHSTGTVSQSQTDECMSLLAKAQHASRMRHKLRGSHGLSAGLLSSMPTILAATPLVPEPEAYGDYSLSVRSASDTANCPDGHGHRRAPRLPMSGS